MLFGLRIVMRVVIPVNIWILRSIIAYGLVRMIIDVYEIVHFWHRKPLLWEHWTSDRCYLLAWNMVEVMGLLLKLLHRVYSRHSVHVLLSIHRSWSWRVASIWLIYHMVIGKFARMRLAREGSLQLFHRNVLVILMSCFLVLLLFMQIELIEIWSWPEFIVLSTVLLKRHSSSPLFRKVT